MNPELLLSTILKALEARLPEGLTPADVESFADRHHARLLRAIQEAFPAGVEPAFTRLREEHRLARIVLDAVQRHLDRRGSPRAGRELADLVEAIDDHTAYEDRVLFPYLRRQLPTLASVVEHAGDEHEYLSEHLFMLVSALRAGRPYEGPAVEIALHHLDEEEAELVLPALALGLARTPSGKAQSRLALFADAIAALEPPA